MVLAVDSTIRNLLLVDCQIVDGCSDAAPLMRYLKKNPHGKSAAC
jgi:hypothetical protein